MKYVSYTFTVIVACLVALPCQSADGKASGSGSGSPKGSGSASSSESGKTDKFHKLGEPLLFKVSSWEKDTHVLVGETIVPDLVVLNDILNLERQLQQTEINEKNPVTRAQRIQDLTNQIAQKSANKYKPSGQRIEMKIQEEAGLRFASWPVLYDDKGNIIDSKEEKKKREDPKHKGWYKADSADVHASQFVKVTIVRKEGSKARLPDVITKGPPPPKPGSDPNADKPQIKLDADIQVSFVLILGESTTPGK